MYNRFERLLLTLHILILWLMMIIFTVWHKYTYCFSSQKLKLFRSNLREVMRKKQFQELKYHLPY